MNYNSKSNKNTKNKKKTKKNFFKKSNNKKQVKVIEKDPIVIALKEDLNSKTIKKIYVEFDRTIKSGYNKIIFDFENVNYIASAGFAFLLYSLRIAHNNKGEIKFANLNNNILELLIKVHLDLTFEIFNNVNEAIISFNNKTEVLFRTEKRKRIKALLKNQSKEDSIEIFY